MYVAVFFVFYMALDAYGGMFSYRGIDVIHEGEMSSIVPTPEIIHALDTAIKKFGRKEFAKKIELDPSRLNYITRWRNPETYSLNIGETYWGQMLPVLQEFLPPSFVPTYAAENVDAPKVKKPAESLKQLQNAMTQLVPNAKHVIAGVINVYGVPVERIHSAINDSDLTPRQKRELKEKIFIEPFE